MSQPPLDLTPFGTNKTNRTTSPIDSITVGGKNSRPYATDTTNRFANTANRFVRAKSKSAHTSRPGARPITVRLIIKKSNLSNDTNSSKSDKKKHDSKKNLRKHKKQDFSDSSLSDSDSSDDSDYRRK